MNFEYMTKGMQVFLAILIVACLILFCIAMAQIGSN